MKIIDRLIGVNFGGKRTKFDGIVLHSTGSRSATSQFGWFSNPKAKASSHVHIASDGTVERYVPEDRVAWANGEGNGRLGAAETQGDGTTAWTEEQLVALSEYIAERYKKEGFPLRLMASSKRSERGIGYHRLGVPASRWGKGLWLIVGGEKWSSAVGKVCPGDKRIAQMPEVLRRVKVLVGSTTAISVPPKVAKPSKAKAPKVTVLTLGSSGSKVKKLQRELNRVFPTYSKLATDGHFGAKTRDVIREFQRRAGLVVDGTAGPLTQSALKKYGLKV